MQCSEVVQSRDNLLQAFAIVSLSHDLVGATSVVKWVPRQDLPVVKHTLAGGIA